MKRYILLFLTLLFSCYSPEDKEIEVYFSPNGGSRDAIISYLNSARDYIYVAMYAFTSRHLAWALKEAEDDGIDVKVVLCVSSLEDPFSKANFLKKNGVSVRIDTLTYSRGGIMHNKFCIIDDSIVITGSYNWTGYAETRNEENLLIIHSKRIARKFKRRFETIWRRSVGLKLPERKSLPKVTIDALDKEAIRRNLGKEVVVKGKVVKVGYSRRSNTYFLNFSEKRGEFTVVIFNNLAEEFLKKGISPRTFEGKEVAVRGKIKYYRKYGYEIILKEVSDIWVVKD